MKQKLIGLEPVKKFLEEAPKGSKIAAMRAIAEYLLGDSNHGLRYAPRKVNHGAGNPYKWTSDAQRRYVFATQDLPYQRTGDMPKSWVMVEGNSDYNTVRVENTNEYSDYVMGDSQQIGHKADGWRYYLDVIASNMTGAINKGQKAVDDFLQKFN